MGKKQKIFNIDLLSALRQQTVQPEKTSKSDPTPESQVVGSHSGLFNQDVQQPRVNFILAGNEVRFTDPTKNASILIGSDRPSTLASGYGGKGAMKANTIDLVVGRMGSQKKLDDGAFVNNSFGGDAARVYISQLTDVDTNFGINEGFSGNIKGRSAVAVKADAVRLVGREGVKIVTGRSHAFRGFGMHGESNSLGGKIQQPAPPIELIAGNVKDESGWLGIGPTRRVLQGVAKGEHVRDSLRDLSDILGEMSAQCYDLAMYSILGYTIIGVAFASSPVRTGWAVAPLLSLAGQSARTINASWQTRINKTFWEINYAQPYGDKYVVSRNVYAT